MRILFLILQVSTTSTKPIFPNCIPLSSLGLVVFVDAVYALFIAGIRLNMDMKTHELAQLF